MTTRSQAYTGRDNLEVMRDALHYNKWLVDLILTHAPRTGRVLDFGAGTGTFAAALVDAGLRPVCLEPDAGLKSMLHAQGLATVGSLAELEDGSFDYVYSLNVLEHIEDDLAALRQLRAKLRPGGLLLIYVPAFAVLYSAMDRKVGHFRRYRRHSLMRLMRGAGLEVRVARYADSLGFLAALAYRVAGNDSGDIDPAMLRLYDRFAFRASLLLDRICSRVLGKNLLVLARRV